ncbi:MAG: hypothetical protein QOJ59_3484, partial [Thermomicrobiales bacterium]|nr:hypothetical protein [Thermomicrobiales bacterium]
MLPGEPVPFADVSAAAQKEEFVGEVARLALRSPTIRAGPREDASAAAAPKKGCDLL